MFYMRGGRKSKRRFNSILPPQPPPAPTEFFLAAVQRAHLLLLREFGRAAARHLPRRHRARLPLAASRRRLVADWLLRGRLELRPPSPSARSSSYPNIGFFLSKHLATRPVGRPAGRRAGSPGWAPWPPPPAAARAHSTGAPGGCLVKIAAAAVDIRGT